ncbi:MAG TPA: choice-of-anchor I family protein [Flavobacteriales bacterium]|nr:choice-of-anchor I family protein [Flavobacteriales bacterium]
MKKSIIAFSFLICLSVLGKAQGPKLIISEFMPNPPGTDSPQEYVELLATSFIDFSVTPYSVVFTNNSATANGWVQGSTTTYAFNINTGTVNAGDVVYVGGDGMAPTGTKLRVINTGTTGGDVFGSLSTGPLGNGGSNADGVGVFNVAASAITSNTIPIDAVFFGTGVGGAEFAGTGGYTLPYNDHYAGGNVKSTSFLAPDPASGNAIIASGIFNTTTGSFTTQRTFTILPATDLVSAITFSTTPGNVSFAVASTNQTVNETTASATFNITVTSANSAQAIVQVVPSALSTATLGVDYTISNNIIVAPAGSTVTQVVTINMLDDASIESSEYAIFSLTPLTNATVTGGNLHAFYIKDDDNIAPAETNELVFQLLGSYSNGTEGSNSAEIVAHDPTTQRLYIANSIGAKLDIVDFSNPSSPSLISSVVVTPTYGNINSVAVNNGTVACAIESTVSPQDSGKVVFFDANGTFISSVKVGAMPDMLTFNHAGTKVIVACEGEPNAAYTNDPEGRVCSIDISGGVASVTQSNVSFINFTAYDGMETTLRAMGIRIYGPFATTSKDFEPEYVTISDDDQIAWVSLQENNALAQIDLNTNTIIQLMPLGYKDLSLPGNGLDASDQTVGINIANFPVKAMNLPDALAHMTIGGVTYVVTANEGDSREYAGFSEPVRLSTMTLDAIAFPNAAQLKSNVVAGRLNMTNQLGDIDSDGDFDELYSLGGRSFSIYNGTTGALVFDSGDDFERIISQHPTYSALFNASNTSGAAVAKNRSDDKGPECEGVTVAQINNEWFAFASLERVGGVMIYNITDPLNPVYVGYHNNRSFATNGPDRGAEGMIYIDAADSPNGNAIMLLANEISSTLTIYQINTCEEMAGVNLTSTNGAAICSGDITELFTAPLAGVTYQWYDSGGILAGETDTVLNVATANTYSLHYISSTYTCADASSVDVTVNPLPVVVASASAATVCSNEPLTLTGSGAVSYAWDNGATDAVPFLLSTSTTFTLVGTDANGCSGMDNISISVNTAPAVSTISTDYDFCVGGSTTLTASGASTISWSGGISNGVSFSPTTTNAYIATGTDASGCSDTDTVTITVHPLPTVGAIATNSNVCQGNSTALNGTGASTYSWSDGVVNGFGFVPTSTHTYVVTGTDINGCINTGSILITVLSLPAPTIVNTAGVLSIPTYTTMQWYLNGVSIPGATASSYTPAVDGDYSVVVTDPNGCTGNSATYTLNTSGVTELSEGNFSIYPNPFNNMLNIINKNNEVSDLTIIDALGKVVYRDAQFISGQIDLSNLSNGIYHVKIQAFANQYTKVVVKN